MSGDRVSPFRALPPEVLERVTRHLSVLDYAALRLSSKATRDAIDRVPVTCYRPAPLEQRIRDWAPYALARNHRMPERKYIADSFDDLRLNQPVHPLSNHYRDENTHDVIQTRLARKVLSTHSKGGELRLEELSHGEICRGPSHTSEHAPGRQTIGACVNAALGLLMRKKLSPRRAQEIDDLCGDPQIASRIEKNANSVDCRWVSRIDYCNYSTEVELCRVLALWHTRNVDQPNPIQLKSGATWEYLAQVILRARRLMVNAHRVTSLVLNLDTGGGCRCSMYCGSLYNLFPNAVVVSLNYRIEQYWFSGVRPNHYDVTYQSNRILKDLITLKQFAVSDSTQRLYLNLYTLEELYDNYAEFYIKTSPNSALEFVSVAVTTLKKNTVRVVHTGGTTFHRSALFSCCTARCGECDANCQKTWELWTLGETRHAGRPDSVISELRVDNLRVVSQTYEGEWCVPHLRSMVPQMLVAHREAPKSPAVVAIGYIYCRTHALHPRPAVLPPAVRRTSLADLPNSALALVAGGLSHLDRANLCASSRAMCATVSRIPLSAFRRPIPLAELVRQWSRYNKRGRHSSIQRRVLYPGSRDLAKATKRESDVFDSDSNDLVLHFGCAQVNAAKQLLRTRFSSVGTERADAEELECALDPKGQRINSCVSKLLHGAVETSYWLDKLCDGRTVEELAEWCRRLIDDDGPYASKEPRQVLYWLLDHYDLYNSRLKYSFTWIHAAKILVYARWLLTQRHAIRHLVLSLDTTSGCLCQTTQAHAHIFGMFPNAIATTFNCNVDRYYLADLTFREYCPKIYNSPSSPEQDEERILLHFRVGAQVQRLVVNISAYGELFRRYGEVAIYSDKDSALSFVGIATTVLRGNTIKVLHRVSPANTRDDRFSYSRTHVCDWSRICMCNRLLDKAWAVWVRKELEKHSEFKFC